MTSRERWVLYPLLFLTLGIVMRDKLVPDTKRIAARQIRCEHLDSERIDVRRIRCEHLDIVGPTGKHVVRLTAVGGNGQVEVRSKDGKMMAMVGANRTGESGFVETLNSQGRSQVILWSHPCGGMVTTVGADGDIRLEMGHLGTDYGVFAESAELGRRIKLSSPRRLDD